MRKMRSMNRVIVSKHGEEKNMTRWRQRWKNNIKVDFKELWCVQTVHEPGLGQGPFMIMVINLWMSNKAEHLDHL
jgi:hypothetical protein